MTTDQLTAEQKAASPFFESFWPKAFTKRSLERPHHAHGRFQRTVAPRY